MLELAKTVIDLTGSPSELIFKDLPFDDPKQRQPDIAMARAELDWEPTVQLADGLTRTIDYFRSMLSV
jgi:UDP-glucuronate decarboxylase